MSDSMTEAVAQHFLGKVVTVLTNSTALPLKDGIAHSQYFTGELIRVDKFGVYLKHPQIGTLSFYTFPLVGLIEEQYIPKDDPRHQEIQIEIDRKEEAKKKEVAKAATPPKTVIRSNQFVKVEDLKESLAKVKGNS